MKKDKKKIIIATRKNNNKKKYISKGKQEEEDAAASGERNPKIELKVKRFLAAKTTLSGREEWHILKGSHSFRARPWRHRNEDSACLLWLSAFGCLFVFLSCVCERVM